MMRPYSGYLNVQIRHATQSGGTNAHATAVRIDWTGRRLLRADSREAKRQILDVLSPWRLRRVPRAEGGYIFRTVTFFLVGCAILPRIDEFWYRSSG